MSRDCDKVTESTLHTAPRIASQGDNPMDSRLILRMMAPAAGAALVLLTLGSFTAWYVHDLQRDTVDTQKMNVAKVTAIEELVVISHDLIHELTEYMLSDYDDVYVEKIRGLVGDAQEKIKTCNQMADTADEQEDMRRILSGYERFEKTFENIVHMQTAVEARDVRLRATRQVMRDSVLGPVRGYRDFIGEQMKVAAQRDQALADRMGIGLFVLGACGGVAGLMAGYGFARSVQRSIVQFSVPIHDAAGHLSEVIGPMNVSAETLDDLESTMQTVADRVGSVVEQLHASEAAARRSEQLASLGQLAAGIAHELRNPLTSMKVIVQTAAEYPDEPNLDARDLSILLEEITRLEQRIQSFLDFARPAKPVRRPCVVRHALVGTIDLVSFRAKQLGIEIVHDLPEKTVEICADEGQLREVLLNLLLNAIDASPEKSTVRVRLSHHPCHHGPDDADVPAELAGSGYVRIDVEDQGTGLPDAIRDEIFEPFVSSKESGTGLGLSICRRIVEDHDGRITATNLTSGGARFSIFLPVDQCESITSD